MRSTDGALGTAMTTRAALAVLATALALAVLALPVAAAGPAGGGEGNLPRYWQIHAALLSIGTVLFVASYGALWLRWLSKLDATRIPIVKRLSRLWYRAHIWLGVLGVAFALAGIVWGLVMVHWAYGGTHLRVPHAWVGVLTGIIVVAPVATGLLHREVKERKGAVRWWHLALGFFGIALMLAGAITGWALE
jgi:hypothetical protein